MEVYLGVVGMAGRSLQVDGGVGEGGLSYILGAWRWVHIFY